MPLLRKSTQKNHFEWQEPHIAQPAQLAQLQPQADFPCFLSFLSIVTIKKTITVRIADTRIVPKFDASHINIVQTPSLYKSNGFFYACLTDSFF